MVHRVEVRRGAYVDSVRLMTASRSMRELDGVEWAGALMGTSANVASLTDEGFDASELAGVEANDLVVAVRAAGEDEARGALEQAATALAGDGSPAGDGGGDAAGGGQPVTLGEALERLPGANVALVSVPGPYAALEAHKALSAGLHVLLFSDNVALDDEVELKRRAAERGLLVMGPGAGTAALAGVGLGFANAVSPGRVGVVAAAGTGAQEVMSLLDRWGAGVTEVIGVGGRDLSAAVDGRMLRAAVGALRDDDRTDLVLVVSKPPAPDVAASVLRDLAGLQAVVALLGLEDPPQAPPGVRTVSSLEGAVLETLAALGLDTPDPAAGLAAVAESAAARLPEGRCAVRGLYSGGTLCYEALVTVSRRLGPVHSNTPLRPEWGLPAPDGAHICLDLGEEEYTRGRPHPMIDPAARADLIAREGDDPATAALVLDVVLGYGAHPDPASVLAPPCAEVTRRPDAPAVVVYVLGTDTDPQDRAAQCAAFEEAGCVLVPTAARAALLAAAVAARRPEIAEERA